MWQFAYPNTFSHTMAFLTAMSLLCIYQKSYLSSCTHNVTENVNKCCKFDYCMTSTFSRVQTLWLNHMIHRPALNWTYSITTHSNTVLTMIMFKYTGNRNHTITKFASFVQGVCTKLCTKFCNKETLFDKAIAKILKIPMGPSSRTWEWPMSVLILRGLWLQY